MADLTITAANVAAGTDAIISKDYNAGATITAGQAVYLDTTTTPYTWKLADCDSATAAARSYQGSSLHGALSGQPLAVITGGSYTVGATMTAGLAYYLSKTAGGLCPVADIAAGGYSVVAILATSTTAAKLVKAESGVAV